MGARIKIGEDETLLERLLEAGIPVGHDCGGKLACSSCRVSVLEGAPRPASEDELDLIDRAGAGAGDRLACQVSGPAEVVVLDTSGLPAMPEARGVALSLTSAAAVHLDAQMQAYPGSVGVRVTVAPSGCSGLRHRIEPALRLEDGDRIFQHGSVSLVVREADLAILGGTTIDLEQTGVSRKLRFSNPNATATCGCGESFSTAA